MGNPQQLTLNLPQPPYRVELGFFSGPLDLLLHLVRNQEVPVSEVNMSVVAEQYLSIIHSARASELDLELASEYLVVAATLLSIKSELLLPSQKASGGEEQEESQVVYEELRQRLMQYERFKERAHDLVRTPQLGVDTFTRVDRSLFRPSTDILVEDEDGQSLAVMFVRLLKRIGETANSFRVRLESISVVDFMMRTLNTLQTMPAGGPRKRSFITLVRDFVRAGRGGAGEAVGRRGMVIGSFVAVLELVKRGVVSVSQSIDAGEITVELRLQEASEDEALGEEQIIDIAAVREEWDEPRLADDAPEELKEANSA